MKKINRVAKNNGPQMFDNTVGFAGITLDVDPINRSRTEKSDNVMAMFYEEQPLMWEFVKAEIQKTIKEAKGGIDFLDVGTGSGVWSILVAKNLRAKNILAIDKNCRAIEWAKNNAKKNNVKFTIRKEFYNISTAPYQSCKVIGLYPPYHLYPKEVELKIPQHARGGIDGQQIFREQLVVADYHLARNGIAVFNQMCLGRNGRPEFVNYIPDLLRETSLKYANIFPAIKTVNFLQGVYGDKYSTYVKEMSEKFPELYFCNGVIRRDGKGEVEEVKHELNVKNRSWDDRIKLHYQISLHSQN